METHPVDPRDTERDEYNPAYRVCFWERTSYPGVPPEQIGYMSDAYEITGAADVRDVLKWADENVGPNRAFTVYVMLDQCEIRLFGKDPTRASDS